MIKCEAIQQFTYGDFHKLKNIVRKDQNEEGKIFIGDTFECSKKIAKYLSGENDKNICVIKIIEIIPKKSGKNE